jgi:predicted DNA-binding protein (MmcQ/YjbR family)
MATGGDVGAISRDDDEVLARVRRICQPFPEVEEVQLQDRPLFRVRRRRFAIVNGRRSPPRPRWQGFGPSLHVVTDPIERAALQHDPRFTASPHHGDRGWMALDLESGLVDWDEVAELIEAGYRHVAGRGLVELLDEQRRGGRPPA